MIKTRILLLYNNNELDRQVLEPVNYLLFEDGWKKQHGGNSGNKLFISAVEQYLTKEDIEYEYYTGEQVIEDINNSFQMAVLPLANIFNADENVVRQLNEYTHLIEKFKIPVYILGCGIQCKSYDDIDELANAIRTPVERFLKAIYQTGGELALRGYATKEFLDKIMLNSAVVTGCPSIYQRGYGLQLTNEKVEEKIFRPLINGNLKYLKEIDMLSAFEKYATSIYLDQDEFSQWLYFSKIPLKDKSIWRLVRKKTYWGVRLLSEGRIKLLYDVPYWIKYLQTKGFHFSCGSRIHGNIAAILAGIPAMVVYRDARTRELAEFLELPCCSSINGKVLYEEYLQSDYTQFNKGFANKFKAFERFMVSHGISHDIEDRTLFDNKLAQNCWHEPELIGKKNIEYIKKKFYKNTEKFRYYEEFLEKIKKGI